jgi:hypothetical protein
MDVQLLVSLALVLLAVAYLVRSAYRRWQGSDEGCAGCHGGCPSAPLQGPSRPSSGRAGGRQLLELPSIDTTKR